MTAYFFDTSALAKRYIHEMGSQWVRQITRINSGNMIAISALTLVEFSALIARRQKGGMMTPAQANFKLAIFTRHHQHQYGIFTLDSLIFDAQTIARKYELRALDSIQLACAIRAKVVLAQPIIFVASDRELLTAAQAEKFIIDDPLLHP